MNRSTDFLKNTNLTDPNNYVITNYMAYIQDILYSMSISFNVRKCVNMRFITHIFSIFNTYNVSLGKKKKDEFPTNSNKEKQRQR